MLGNTLWYICKELLDNTDRSGDKRVNYIEYNTGTAYLIHEVFDTYEKLCVKVPEHIEHYFSSLIGYVLGRNDINEQFKQRLVNSSFYFICNRYEENRNIKNNVKIAFKKFLEKNKQFVHYFDLNMHDRITHYHDTGSTNIFEIIDNLK